MASFTQKRRVSGVAGYAGAGVVALLITFVIFPQILFLLLFLLTAIFFGYITSFIFLGERKCSLLIPLSIVLGFGGYPFIVNAVSYAMPIAAAIWLVLVAYAAFIVYQLYSKGLDALTPEIDFTGRELKILFGSALVVATLLGTVQLRILSYDDYVHLAFASSIAAGNFPVMNPMDPDTALAYHYGPDLLAGAVHVITGIPLLQGYDVQTFIFTLATFLLAFALAFRISRSFPIAILASAFFIYGSGAILFVHIFDGIGPLYHKYVLHEPVVGVWKFLADMIFPQLNHLYTKGILNHTFAMGTPILLAIVYLYFKLEEASRSSFVAWAIVGLLLGSLALSVETTFVILSFVLLLSLLYKIYKVLTCGDFAVRRVYARGIISIGAALLIGSIVAVLQGGVITVSLFNLAQHGAQHTDVMSGNQHFSLNKDPLVLTIPFNESGQVQLGSNENISLYSPLFLEEFGLLLIVFVAAFFAFRKNREALFLSSIGIVAFLTPILITYDRDPSQLIRIFSVSTTIFSFMCALYIGRLIQTHARDLKIRYFLVLLSLLLLYDGFAFQVAGVVTPLSSFGKIHVPFIAWPPQLSSVDESMYQWISSNTLNTARFFPYSERLIIETGRMSSPGNDRMLVSQDKIALHEIMFETCGADIAKKLGITYIVVSPDGFSRDRFKRECSTLHTKLVFSTQAGDDYRDIYQVD